MLMTNDDMNGDGCGGDNNHNGDVGALLWHQ
jgi:hypothetical protein